MTSKSIIVNLTRNFTTSCTLNGKRNFRKFNLYEKRGSQSFQKTYKKLLRKNPDHPAHKLLKVAYNRGDRPVTLLNAEGKEELIPEMIPELIVPDLEGFQVNTIHYTLGI